MAADEALLESVASTDRPALRFYTWEPATLSLGYFQPSAGRLATEALAVLPYVRRPSGGGAIVHHHELTYALALPDSLRRAGGSNWICRFHGIIGSALASLGVRTEPCGCGHEKGRGAFLCFEHQTPGDLLIDGHKVVGSAQRKRGGAVLQHGSILLAASPHAPTLPGIRNLTGVAVDPDSLAAAIPPVCGRELSWSLVTSDWPAGFDNQVEAHAAAKYRRPEWNDRR